MSHTVVLCRSQYPVNSDYNNPVMFEPTCIRLGPGLTITSGVVCTDDTGCFNITIQNDSVLDYELQDDILIGHLVDIEVDRKAGENEEVSQDRTPGHCVWQVNEHTPVRTLVIGTEHLSTRDSPVTVILALPRSNAKAELHRKRLKEPIRTLKVPNVNSSMFLGTEDSVPEAQSQKTESQRSVTGIGRCVLSDTTCIIGDSRKSPRESPCIGGNRY